MNLRTIFWVLVLLVTHNVFAQDEEKEFRISLGYTFIDNRVPEGIGGIFKDYVDGFSDWNGFAAPTNLALEYKFNEKYALQAEVSYAKIKKGFYYYLNDAKIVTDDDFVAFDIKGKYDLNKVFGDTGFFDPYASLGLGFSTMAKKSDFKINAGYGFNIWISEKWGIKWDSGYFHNFKSTFPEYSGTGTDYFQNSFGVIFRPSGSDGRSATWEKKRN